MKKRNLFITLGLALGLGIGALVGLGSRKEVREANAADIGGDTANYVYYVTASSEATGDKVHAWKDGGKTAFDVWPGDSIASVGTDVTGVMNFEGSYKKIYKICFDEAPEGFMFTWGDGSGSEFGGKTADFTYNCGRAYWWSGDTNGVAAAGEAIDLLVEVEKARNTAASYQGHSYSICGITASKAVELYTSYEGLSASAKTMFDNSTTKTYNGKNSSGVYDWNESTSITFPNIMAELYKIALNDGAFAAAHGSRGILNSVQQFNNSTIIIISVSAISLIAVSAFFLLRKKKESK